MLRICNTLLPLVSSCSCKPAETDQARLAYWFESMKVSSRTNLIMLWAAQTVCPAGSPLQPRQRVAPAVEGGGDAGVGQVLRHTLLPIGRHHALVWRQPRWPGNAGACCGAHALQAAVLLTDAIALARARRLLRDVGQQSRSRMSMPGDRKQGSRCSASICSAEGL